MIPNKNATYSIDVALYDVDPEAQHVVAHFGIRYLILQDTAVVLDDLPRCRVTDVGSEQDTSDAELFCLAQSKPEDRIAVALPALTRSDVVADVSADAKQIVGETVADTHATNEDIVVDKPELGARDVAVGKVVTSLIAELCLYE